MEFIRTRIENVSIELCVDENAKYRTEKKKKLDNGRDTYATTDGIPTSPVKKANE